MNARTSNGMVAGLLCSVCVGLVAPSARGADANVIGFWDFKDGTVGEEAGTVYDTSHTWEGTAYKANGNTGNIPTYSNARPSAVIYTDNTKAEVLASKPQSLHFSIADSNMGGIVDIAGLSSELTAQTAFTVEFFSRLDDSSGNLWSEPVAFRTLDRYASVTVGCGNTSTVKFNNLNVANPNVGSITSGSFSQGALGVWLHFAMVYEQTDAETSSGTLKCYVNRVLKGTLAYTNTPLGSTSMPLRLGTSIGNGRVAHASYCYRGDICALRIKSVALSESGFMTTGDEMETYAVPDGEMLGFWDFKDGAVGTSATSVTNKGYLSDLGPGVGSALTDKSNDAGMVPLFSDDVPGRYVYSSGSYATLLAEQPQSLLFTTVNAASNTQSDSSASVGGGKILLPDIGSAISAQKSYTIECFFKDEDWSNWQWQSGLFGFLVNKPAGGSQNFQAMVSSIKSDKTTWDFQVNGAKYTKSSTWKDGNWHHLAAVYDGSASNVTLYVDYEQGTTVSYTNAYRAGESFALGTRADQRTTYAFRGKVACLRIMPKALASGEFMVAVNKVVPEGTIFAWNFEEGVGRSGVVVTNAAGLPSENEKSANNTQVYCLHKDTLPKYSTDVAKGRVTWDGDALWTNNVSVWFQGYYSLASETANRNYAGTEMSLPASTLPWRNPTNWTMEAMVKIEYMPNFINETSNGVQIFGKHGNAYPHPKGSTPVLYPKYSWFLSYLPNGKLKLMWTVDDGQAHTSSSSNKGEAVTSAQYLTDRKWHHVALTYDKPTRTFTLYVDYESVLTQYIGEHDLYDGPYGYYFSRMESTYGFEGWMDEIRFTGHVLDSSKFVRFEPISGMTIIFR